MKGNYLPPAAGSRGPIGNRPFWAPGAPGVGLRRRGNNGQRRPTEGLRPQAGDFSRQRWLR